jgi:hypothetical protein
MDLPASTPDTPLVATLLELLTSEFERPRVVTRQVIDHVVGTYDIEREAIGEFLEERLPKLEDYEHDLILSPLFTPKLADQALFAELLGDATIPRDRWPELIQQLASKPTLGSLVTDDKQTHRVTLREVTLERYVYRLRLDGTIDKQVLGLIEGTAFLSERPVLRAIGRRAVWENDDRRDILIHYLSAAEQRREYEPGDAVDLLRIVEDYKPANVANLIERIPPWLEGLRQEIRAAGEPKPFFSGATQMAHGGDRDTRQQDTRTIAAKKREFAFLERLHRLLVG